jgi:hypothetical protein
MTIYFLKTVEILPKQSEYSSQIGSKGGSAIFKAIWKLLANQPKNTWILLGSTFCLGGLLIDYYQARHERSKGLCWDKCLLCANQISRIAIIVLAGRLSPLLVGGLDLTISLTSYTRFLMTAKS